MGKQKVVPVDPAGGNTKPPPKQISPSKNWIFVWNNYPEDYNSSIVPKFQASGKKTVYGFQPEKGSGFETPHIQGWISFQTKIRPMSLGLPKEIHWEKMKGSIADSVAYCSKSETKDGDYVTNIKMKIDMECTDDDVVAYDELPEWSRKLVDMVGGTLPDKKDRRVWWVWSAAGQMFKTETARHLVYHHDAVIIQGGRKHVLATAYKNAAPIYILTVPRTDEGFVSYASIELLKDNLYMSGFGTEATGMVNRKKPWVIVMANFRYCEDAISVDRWVDCNVDA